MLRIIIRLSDETDFEAKLCKFVKTSFVVFIVRDGTGKEKIEEISKKLWPDTEADAKDGFNARKYNGVLKMKGDTLAIQKKLRDDWERTIN